MRSFIVCFVLAAATAGCSRGPTVAPVGGIVTLGGVPVDGGQIMFVPTAAGLTAVGKIGPDGRYTLTTRKPDDGAVIGNYTVAIEPLPEVPGVALPEELFEKKTKPTVTGSKIPQKYSVPGKSGLSATVTSGSNSIDFALE